MRAYRTTVSLITIVMSSAIAVHPRRVWRALTDTSECIAWDENRLSALDATDVYPVVGETMRWRYRLGSVPIVMRDQPIDVVPGIKIQSKVTLGSLRFNQTFSLALEHASTDTSSDENEGVKTLLGMKVIASNSTPVLGAVIDRFEVRRITIDHVDGTLRAITQWCENGS